MFVRPGEYVNLQVEHPISKSGKEKTLKFADVELELEVLLAYVGAKRPKSSSVKPGESPELKEFLEEKMCMTVEEFEKMKNSTGKEEEDQNGTDTKSKKGDDKSVKAKAAKTRTGGTSRFDPNPPAISDMFAAQAAAQKTNSAIMSGPATSLNRTVQASTLTARAMMLQGVHDAKLPHLLESDVDIENAIFLSKMFTTALLHKMQDQVLSKALEMKHGKQFINIVQGQKAQATKFEETINEGKRLMEDKKKRAIEAEKTEFNKKVDEQLRAVEESMREETRKRATKSLSTVGSSKKMKAMLESYKASKSKAQENTQNISPTQNVPSVEKEITRCYNETPQDLALEQTMSPLQLLRLYTVQNRKVTCENDKIYFGRLSFPKDTKTNFKVTRVNELEAQYYTMDALVNFLAHMHKSHSNYIRDSLRFENILIVRRQDRSYLEDYLTGKIDNCPNLVQLSHEQLNPEQTSLQRLGPVAPSAKVQENIAAKMDEWKIKNMTEKDYLKSVQPAQSETQAVHMMSLPTPAPIQKPPMMNQQAFVPLNQQQQPLNSMVQQGSFHGSEYGGGLPVPVNAMSSAQVGNWGEPLVQTGVGMMMPSRESVSSLRAMANSSKLTKPDDYSQREMDIERPLSPEWGGSKIDIGRSQSPMRKLQAKETRWIEEPELVGSWNTNSAELEATKKNRSFSPRHSYQPDDPTTSPKRRVSPARRSPSRRRPSPMRRSPPRRNVSPLRRSPLRRNVSPIRRSSPVRSAAPGRLPSPSQVSRRPSPPRLSSMSRPSFNMTSNSEKRSSAQEREIMPFRKDPNISNEFQKFRGEEERRHGSHLSDNQSLSREENNYQRSQQIEPSTRFSGSQVRNDSPEFRKSNQSPEPRYDLSSRNNRLPEPRRSEDIERPSRASRFDDLDANRSGSRFGLSNSGEQSRGVSVELLNAPETSARFRNTGDPRSQQIGNIMDRPGSRDLEDSRRETSFDSLRMRQSIANQDRPSRDFPQSQDASGYQGSSYPSQRPGNDFGSSRDDNSYAPHHRDKDLGSQRDGSQKGEHRFGLTPGDSMGPSQGRDLFRPSQGGNTQGPSLGGNNFGQPSAGDHVPPQGGNYGGPQVGDYGTPKGANNFGSQQGGENFGFSQGGNNFGQPQGGGNLGGRDDQQRVSRFDQGPSYGQSDFGGGNSMSGNFNQGAQPGFQSDFGAGAPPTRQW